MCEVGQNLHFFFFSVKVFPPCYESTTCSLQKTWKTVEYSIHSQRTLILYRFTLVCCVPVSFLEMI